MKGIEIEVDYLYNSIRINATSDKTQAIFEELKSKMIQQLRGLQYKVNYYQNEVVLVA